MLCEEEASQNQDIWQKTWTEGICDFVVEGPNGVAKVVPGFMLNSRQKASNLASSY